MRPEEPQDGVNTGLAAAAQADAEQRSAAARRGDLNAVLPGSHVAVEIVRDGLHEQRGEHAARGLAERAHREVRMSVDACPEIDPRGCLTAVPFFMFQFEQRRQVPMCQPPGMGLLVDDGTRSDRGREKEIAIHRQRFAHGITADADSGDSMGRHFSKSACQGNDKIRIGLCFCNSQIHLRIGGVIRGR
ncbi:hypothetical protein ACKZDW_25250 [Ralstonia syzygii subsp. celebesensis]